MTSQAAMRQGLRFAPRDELPVHAFITAADREMAGHLADLSFSGARVEVDRPLAFETPVQLSLRCAAVGLDLKLEAVVRWARPQGNGGRWSLGLSFSKVASEGQVAAFFTQGIIDRRNTSRVAVSVEAPARFELSADETQIALLDAAPGGCCLSVAAPCRAGQKVRFAPPEAGGQTLLAEVCWARRVEDRWLAGCRFLPECSRAAVDALFERVQVPRRRRGELLVAAALMLALTAGAAAWTWALLT